MPRHGVYWRCSEPDSERPPAAGEASAGVAATEAANDQEQQGGADEGDDDHRDDSGAEVDVEQSEEPAAQKGPEHADDHVREQAAAHADDPAGQQARDQADHQEDQEFVSGQTPEVDGAARDVDARQGDTHDSWISLSLNRIAMLSAYISEGALASLVLTAQLLDDDPDHRRPGTWPAWPVRSPLNRPGPRTGSNRWRPGSGPRPRPARPKAPRFRTMSMQALATDGREIGAGDPPRGLAGDRLPSPLVSFARAWSAPDELLEQRAIAP